jgi:hypothetical protein
MATDFMHSMSDGEDYKRDVLIKKIEHSVEKMSLRELEAVAYDLFTKGYLEEY